ncbi:MAG: hypothetical protein J0M13_09205 [Candidatus Accumulibacter sp.]|jgi:hypothetical protein|nr:hypothetical protein [Candidatus Accumulibacter necessarius]
MKFRDLLSQPYNKDTEIIYPDALRILLPETPLDVIEQVYSHHGRKGEFQEQYADLELSSIAWVSAPIFAAELIQASFYPGFANWFRTVEARPLAFAECGWRCIDTRADVIEHWTKHQTWSREPVLIKGFQPAVAERLHLVEGHTRVALLSGLVKSGVLSPKSEHQVFVGRAGAPNE